MKHKTTLPITLDLASLICLANHSVEGPLIIRSPEHDLTLGLIVDAEGVRLSLWYGVDDPETSEAIIEELSL